MKLGTKIVMGFVLTNVIFIILVVSVYIFMRPVQHGAINLSENVLKLMDEASNIQYSSAREVSEIRAYLGDPDNDQKIWDRAMSYSKLMTETLADVEANLGSPNARV